MAGLPLGAQTTESAPSPARDGAPRVLTLEDAVSLARRVSDSVKIAAADVARAASGELSARSAYFPQVTGTVSYTRTLQSPYSVLSESSLSSAGLGAANSYNFSLSTSWSLVSPGRRAQQLSAVSSSRSAAIEVTAQEAQAVLDVTEAYYDAVLSDTLLAIAESSLAQSERVLVRTRASRDEGDQSGYEVLRAQVARDNQVPTLVQRRATRDLAYDQLKQLLDIDIDMPIRLSSNVETGLDPSTVSAAAITTTAAPIVTATAADADSVAARAAVRQQLETVTQAALALDNARAQKWPTVSLSGSAGVLAYPSNAVPTSLSQLLPSSSIGLSMSVPIFTGGQQRANELSAEASLREAQTRLHQTQLAARLDRRSAQLTLAQAEASYTSSAQTATQAVRANEIAEVRYREGLTNLTELGDARIDEATARANRAQAARDMRVARVRLALINDLPLSTTSTGTSTTTSSSSSSSSTSASTSSTSSTTSSSTSTSTSNR